MISFKEPKKSVFDKEAIIKAVGKAKAKVMALQGAEIRRQARRLIKNPSNKRQVSAAGQPPINRTGLLRNFILFSFDTATRSLVVGPAKLNVKSNAPNTLEFSGMSESQTVNRIGKGGGTYKVTRPPVKIEARPYMGPALEKATPRLAALWENSVKAG